MLALGVEEAEHRGTGGHGQQVPQPHLVHALPVPSGRGGQVVDEQVLDLQQPLGLRDPDGEGGDGLRDRVDVLGGVLDEAVGELGMARAVQVQGAHAQALLQDPLAQRQQEEVVGGRRGVVAHRQEATVVAP